MTDRAIELAIAETAAMLKSRIMQLYYEQQWTAQGYEIPKNEYPSDPVYDLLDGLDSDAAHDLFRCCDEVQMWREWGRFARPPLDKELPEKVKSMINKTFALEKVQESAFCALVFVRERFTAALLALVLQTYPSLKHLRSDYMIGHAGTAKRFKKSLHMGVELQKQIVSDFKSGKINILVATEVAEEGLDIKPCNVVVRFDMPDTLSSYIQSRGRARQRGSKFVILASQGDDSAEITLKEFKEEELIVHDILEANADRICEFDATEQVYNDSFFHNEKTSAIVTLHNAISIVNQYCNSLPGIMNYKPKVEYTYVQQGGLCGRITLPRSAHIECQELVGPPSASRIDAKRLVAFEMAKRLFELNELDEYFQSKNKFKKARLDQIVTGRGDSFESYALTAPSVLAAPVSNCTVFWLTVITMTPPLDSKRALTVGLLTAKNPDDPEFAEPFLADIVQEEYTIRLTTLKTPLNITQEMLYEIQSFHHLFFKSLIRSEFTFETDWSMLCVPLIYSKDRCLAADISTDPFHILCWDTLHRCIDGDDTDLDPDNLDTDILLFDVFRWKRTYQLLEVAQQYTPMSIMKEDGKEVCMKTIYQRLLKCKEPIDEEQPLFLCKPIGYPHCSFRKKKEFDSVHLIPQLCSILPIRKPHLLDGLYFPIVLQYVHHRMLALDIRQGTPFSTDGRSGPNATLRDLTAALTTPNAGLEYDYERLEMLGDSFLKCFLSMHMFVKFPNAHEGFLTVSRVALENNMYLKGRATALGLDGYIHSIPFDRRTWLPAIYPRPGKQRLSDKCLADVIEAILGAACLKDVKTAPYAVHLLIGDVCESNWDIYASEWALHRSQALVFAPCILIANSVRTIEGLIGYEFKDKALMAQALTHSSMSGAGMSLERLEFLGDAVLGYVVSLFIFQLGLGLDPGKMTGLKSMMVSNQFLAGVCSVLGLSRHMQCGNAGLAETLDNWQRIFMEHVGRKTARLLFWQDLDPAPKVLGDLYEALLGAVYLDSQLDIDIITGVITSTLITPFWPRYEVLVRTQDFLLQDPMRQLKDHVYYLPCNGLDVTTEREIGGYLCIVKFHDVEIGRTIMPRSHQAKKYAAESALVRLQDLENMPECNCNIRHERRRKKRKRD